MLVMDFVPSDDKRYRYGNIYPNIKYAYLGYAIVADLFNLDHNIILKLCTKKLKPDLIKPWRLDGDGDISTSQRVLFVLYSELLVGQVRIPHIKLGRGWQGRSQLSTKDPCSPGFSC